MAVAVYLVAAHMTTGRFAAIQARLINRYVGKPYRVRCFWDGIVASPPKAYETRSSVGIIPAGLTGMYEHSAKLNALTQWVLEDAADDDIVVYLDGDSWPIGDLRRYLDEKMKEFPVVSVRRDEIPWTRFPHPCFTATTAGFIRANGFDWNCLQKPMMADLELYGKQFPGNWKKTMPHLRLALTNPGGVLFLNLVRAGVKWFPMLRSNKIDIHPLFLGVYDDMVFHVGAGFRPPTGPLDWRKCAILDMPRAVAMRHNRELMRAAMKKMDRLFPLWEHLIKGA